MLEKDIVKKIRDYLTKEVGATVHRTHGSAFSERGSSDLYGTLPGGRAIYLEAKVPGRLATLTPSQRTFLQREALKGAVAGAVTSVSDVVELLAYQRYTILPPDKRCP